MGNGLYFIPMIARALDAQDPEEALREAFTAIEQLGQTVEYEEDYGQFRQFMKAVYDQAVVHNGEARLSETAEALLVELAAGALDDSPNKDMALAVIHSRPDWCERYEDFCAALDAAQEDTEPVTVALERPGGIVQNVSLEAPVGVVSIEPISPGDYTIRLSTGRVLWQGALRERDLHWTVAYPGSPLALAADTRESVPERPTLEHSLLDGEVIVRVFAGIEHGRLEVEFRRPEQAEP